jgi:lipopolysaccharide/colanic/teichoic acid biosynthesis glycosyltransferase
MEATLAPIAPLRRGELLEVDRIIFGNVPSKARLQAPNQPAANQAFARRAIDVVVALALLILLAPLFALIAVAIWLDSPGPVLFRQRRLGHDAAPFTMLKFRSMGTDSDEALHRDFATSMIMGDAPEGEVYKVWPDPRVTRVGRWIRTFSLDELPQLWNVLRGDMSLVGFRPPIPYEVECYPEWYYGRFGVKPGITGLWQVSGRNEKTYEEMVAYDIEYAERRDWKLDAQLLFKTVGVVLARRGAY